MPCRIDRVVHTRAMGTRALATIAGLTLLAAAATPAAADGMIVERVQATFKTTRKGAANHAVKLRGMVGTTQRLRDFRPDLSGVRLRVGDFVALAHDPDPESRAFRLKRGVWRYRSKVGSTRTKLTLDTRSGAIRLRVKKGNAATLRSGGPDYALVRLEIGSDVFDDAVVFDERTRRGAVQWKSLPHGSPIEPPGERPEGDPLPGGSLPWTILSRGEHSKVLTPTVMVARSNAEWVALYDQATIFVPNQRPPVDFTREMVIGIFTGLVSQNQSQEIDVTDVTEGETQLWVSWRSRYLCGPFVCTKGGGLIGDDCPDFAPFVFLRVRRVDGQHTSYRGPTVSSDCP